MEESKGLLEKSFNSFIAHYSSEPEDLSPHGYFGMLNYEEWIYFHYKHLEHHLMQFGLIPEPV